MAGAVQRDPARGTWLFVVDLAGPDGRRTQMRRRGFATKREAQAALAIVVAEQSRGVFRRPTRMTLSAYLLDVWLPAKRPPALKPSTWATYEMLVRTCILPRLGSCPLAKISGATLNALYAELAMPGGATGARGSRRAAPGALSPKSVRNVHGVLHKALKDAVKWGHLNVNPCDAADPPRHVAPETGAWNAEEMRRFLAQVADDRLYAIWRLAFTTGMRRGELCGLRWDDLDLTAGRLTIRQTLTMVGSTPTLSTPKSRAGTRTVTLDPATVTALRAWKRRQAAERLMIGADWQGPGSLVLTEPDGSAVHPQVLSRRFKAHAKAADLPPVRFHDVRHSYATGALASGVPVKVLSQRLGHADIGVTLRTYAHVMPGDDEDAARRAAALLDQ